MLTHRLRRWGNNQMKQTTRIWMTSYLGWWFKWSSDQERSARHLESSSGSGFEPERGRGQVLVGKRMRKNNQVHFYTCCQLYSLNNIRVWFNIWYADRGGGEYVVILSISLFSKDSLPDPQWFVFYSKQALLEQPGLTDLDIHSITRPQRRTAVTAYL